jgi:histone-like DNA-binding protein
MNRLELVDRVAARNTASKAEVDRIIVSALEEIISAVRCGESVTLIGFGTFKAVDCAPRTGRNPSTGESIRIPGTKKPKFVPGTSFKELINDDQVIQPFISRPHQRLEVG